MLCEHAGGVESILIADGDHLIDDRAVEDLGNVLRRFLGVSRHPPPAVGQRTLLHRFTHRGGECEMLQGVDDADAPPRISQAGLAGRCQGCADALRMFVSAYGAEAGNLALRGVATSGVYVGGGIAPKILPALQTGSFMEAFVDKEPMRELLLRVPVKVILNPQAGLLGAAVAARELIS